MSDINGLLQEINEELQHQKLVDFWKKWGVTLLTVALVIILGTAAGTGWKTYKNRAQQNATAAYLDILTNPGDEPAKKEAALSAFIEKEPKTTQALLARFEFAFTQSRDGKMDKAIESYDALANDTHIDQAFRDLATFFSVQAQMDNADPKALIARLQPLFAESAFRLSAKEYAAHLMVKAGDHEGAKKLFLEINQDQSTPPTMLMRVRDMQHWLEGGV